MGKFQRINMIKALHSSTARILLATIVLSVCVLKHATAVTCTPTTAFRDANELVKLRRRLPLNDNDADGDYPDNDNDNDGSRIDGIPNQIQPAQDPLADSGSDGIAKKCGIVVLGTAVG